MSLEVDKRYQVFVSSTFQDLQEERQEVMQALLELDCIPAGMELFPAANDDQWTLIKKVIDDCDYYIVISAGRYGSLGKDGVGYTEMEYRYALEKGRPIIGFLHKNPGSLKVDRCEATEAGKEKLQAFRQLVETKACRYWTSPADLGSQVSRSLVKLIKSEPAIGWVRADLLPSADTNKEILDLKKQIEKLHAELGKARHTAPEGAAQLAQGEDKYSVVVEFQIVRAMAYNPENWEWAAENLSWDDIFAEIAPLMISDAADSDLRAALASKCKAIVVPELDEDERFKGYTSLKNFRLQDDSYNTIKVQLRALGYIAKSTRQRSLRDSRTYWTLTPLGDEVMTRLKAVKRKQEAKS